MNLVKEQKWYSKVFDYLMITFGVALMATAINKLFAPNVLAPGGVAGIGVIFKQLFNIPIYITNFAINAPLFIFGARLLGRKTAVRTLYATLLLTLLLKYIPTKALTNDLLLSAIYGGLLNGIGLGLIFRVEGSTGGSDLAAVIMNTLVPKIKLATFMMAIDVAVVIAVGLVEQSAEVTLYSVISIYVTGKLADTILEGINYSKAFYIITSETQRVSEALMEELERGVTALQGKGMYTGHEKEVLLCVVSRAQFATAKEIVRAIDPKAFIMVTEMSEVLGEGFVIPNK